MGKKLKMKQGNAQAFKFRWAFFPNLGLEQDNFDVKACLPKIDIFHFLFLAISLQ